MRASECRLTIDAAAAAKKGSEKGREREFDSAGLKHTSRPLLTAVPMENREGENSKAENRRIEFNVEETVRKGVGVLLKRFPLNLIPLRRVGIYNSHSVCACV